MNVVGKGSLLKRNEGFLLVEILIAGLIITTSIAATMYLFQVGFRHLDKVNVSNQLSSKLSQSINLLKTIDPEEEEGIEDVGDGILLVWKAEVIERTRPSLVSTEGTREAAHELSLYKMSFQLRYNDAERDYEFNVLRYKTVVSPSEMLF